MARRGLNKVWAVGPRDRPYNPGREARHDQTGRVHLHRRRAARPRPARGDPPSPGRDRGARPPPSPPRGLARGRGAGAAPRASSPARRLAARARPLAPVRREHAGRGVERNRVALEAARDPVDRRGGPCPRPSRLSPLRARQLPGGPRSPPRDGGSPTRARARKEAPRGVCRLRSRSGRQCRDVEPARPSTPQEPETGIGMALGGARDGDGALGQARAGAALVGAEAASRVGGLSCPAQARRSSISGDRSEDARLLRLAGRGAGGDGHADHEAPRQVDRRRGDPRARPAGPSLA